jgi:hypothetical protein
VNSSVRGSQTEFPAFYTPSVILPQGDHSYLVKPGKPIDKLKPREAARIIRKSVWTIYRMFEEGLIKGERPTKHGILIYADSLQAHITASQDPEFWGGKV